MECSNAAYLRQINETKPAGLPGRSQKVQLLFPDHLKPSSASGMSNCLYEAPITQFLFRPAGHHSGTLLVHSRPKPWWVTDTEQETEKNLDFQLFQSRHCSCLSHCQGVVLYVSSPVPHEVKSLMVVWRAGKTHKQFKHYILLRKLFSCNVKS